MAKTKEEAKKSPRRSNPELRAGIAELAEIEARPKKLSHKETREFYYRTKDLVIEVEKTNDQCVIAYRRDGNFWQLGGNSALIYYYRLSKQLGLDNVKLRMDDDFHKKKWRRGYVTIGKVDDMVKRLQKLECKVLVNTDEIKVLVLPKKITPEEIEIWANAYDEKQARFNSQVMPKTLYPKIYNLINALHKEMIDKIVAVPEPRRKYYGDMGAEIVTWLNMNVVGMMNGRMGEEEFFEEALEKLSILNDWLVMVDKFKVFDIDMNLRIMEHMATLKNEIKGELAIIKKKKAKNE